MNISADIFSRLKDIARRKHAGLGGHFDTVLRQWLGILIFGLILTLMAMGYAYYNFRYWNDIEARVAEESGPTPQYDQAALKAILLKFDERADLSKSIVDQLGEIEVVSTTTTEAAP